MNQGLLTPLEPLLYRDLVRRALEEDMGAGDRTTHAIVADSARGRGVFLAKSACTLAGLDVAVEAFRQLDGELYASLRRVTAMMRSSTDIAEVTGPRAALTARSGRR